MPRRLHRYYGAGYLHFITTSCYQRRALLGSAQSRDLFLEVLEQVRRRYHFVVVGYVVMTEHAHLLFGEPERGNPSVVMQAIKQGFARRLMRRLQCRDPRGLAHLCKILTSSTPNQRGCPTRGWPTFTLFVKVGTVRPEVTAFLRTQPVSGAKLGSKSRCRQHVFPPLRKT